MAIRMKARGDGVEPEFVTIPAGTFLMGSESGRDDETPIHGVHVDAFALAIYPVRRWEYAIFVQATGHPPTKFWNDPRFQLPNQPVVGPSWFDAVAYCEWLSSRTGKRYRLPTEAEREKAARGGMEGREYPWGDEIPADLHGPNPPLEEVGTEGPNGYGLCDMSVGVHEWCSDRYSAGYYAVSPESNPQGPSAGERRVARGGSWRHAIRYSRCAGRSSLGPEKTFNDFGFRCALTL
jgi:formylglycine-generating enzyme required for sulfatase activity